MKNQLNRFIAMLTAAALILCGNSTYVYASEAGITEETERAEEDTDYIADEVIALCDSEEEADEIAKAYAASTGYKVDVISFSYGVALLKISGKPDIEKLNENVGTDSLSSVESFVTLSSDTSNNLPTVYPNYIRQEYSVANEDEFTDPMLKPDSEGYEGMYQWYHDKINDKFVWDRIDSDTDGLGSRLEDIHIAVLDSGVNYEHDELCPDVVTSHANFIHEYDQKDHPYGDDAQTEYERDGGDTRGHGTNVAGIIADSVNNIGGRGVAAGVKIDSYRVLSRYGRGEDAEIISGINAAIEDKKNGTNIRVINMSLGGPDFNGAYEKAIREARENGILIVAAAGNNNNCADNYPSNYEGVMSVAALNSSYEKSDFSNYGDRVDISAPGGESRVDRNSPTFLDTNPLWASGKRNLEGNMAEVDGRNYSGMNGTSQATPIVSACAAILFADDSSLSPDDVKAILKATARPVKSKYPIGAGCVDLAAAMEIDTTIPAPVASPSGSKIDSGTEINLDMPEGYKYRDYAVIYYTLNGKDPFDAKTKQDDIRMCLPGEYVKPEGAGKVSLCVRARVFGKDSTLKKFDYTFNDSGVTGIDVTAPGITDDTAEVAVGKTIAFKATVFPSYAKNKKVTWSSEDTDIATVDSNGKVKGINTGSTVVTAKSADGSVSCAVTVNVKKVSEQIEILKDEIILTVGDRETGSYMFADGEITVHPSDASQNVILTSTNSKIAVIKEDDQGKQYVEAVSEGEAVIKASTVDGSNVSESIPVSVLPGIKKISISDPAGRNIVLRGRQYSPKTIINDSSAVTSSKEIKYEIVSPDEAKDHIECNKYGFVINTSYDISDPEDIVVRAYSGSGEDKVVSNELKLTLYKCPVSEILPSEKYEDQYNIGWYYYPGKQQDLSDLFEVTPLEACRDLKYSCTSKNVRINQDRGYCIFEKPGEYKVKAEATDGSGKSCELTLYAQEQDIFFTGIRCKTAHAVIYPGKTIELESLQNRSGKFWAKDYYNFGIAGNLNEEKGYPYYESNSYVRLKGNKITGLDGLKYLNRTEWGKLQPVSFGYVYRNWQDYRVYFDSYMDYYVTSVEMYPAATKGVVIGYKDAVYDEASANSKTIKLAPGTRGRINASSLPEGSCQKYYTYRSSNTKVVTVDSNGNIRAVGNGTATVTVTAGDGTNKSAKVSFKVEQAAQSITIGSKTDTFWVIPKKTLKLTATVKPDNTVDKSVEWLIENEAEKEYAKINSRTGEVTGIKPGEVTVSARVKSNPSINISQKITVCPATDSIKVDDPAVASKGLTLYTQNLGGCVNKGTFTFTVQYATAGEIKSEPSVTSSNPAIVTASKKEASVIDDENGSRVTYKYDVTVVGAKAGSAKVNIAATDGSGKKATVSVKVLVPVTDINILTNGGAYTVTAGKKLTLTTSTNKDASNKKVIWSFAGDGEKTAATALGIDTAQFEKNGTVMMDRSSTGAGSFSVKATAADGSGTSKELTIYTRPRQVTGIYITKDNAEVKSANLGVIPKPEASSDDYVLERIYDVSVESKTKTDTADASEFQQAVYVKSSNEAIARARILPDGKLHIYTYKNDEDDTYVNSKTGKVTITVTSTDGSNKSAKITINVIDPVRKILLSADKNTRDIAANSKLSFKATVNAGASNKKLSWSILDKDGNPIADPKPVATISSSGVLTPNSKLDKVTDIRIRAQACDGSGTKAEEAVTIYPAQGKPSFVNSSGNPVGITMNMDEGADETITVKGLSGVCADYTVTYTTGPVKIQYVTKSKDGTSFRIRALKKGTSKITATARDGSGKSATFNLKVIGKMKEKDVGLTVKSVPKGVHVSYADDAPGRVERARVVAGKTVTLIPVLTSTADDKTVTFISSAPDVASVSPKGEVTAKSHGRATVTMRTNDGGFEASCDITVPYINEIVWLGDSLTQGGLRAKNDNLANAPYVKLEKQLTANNICIPVYGLGLWGKNTQEILAACPKSKIGDPHKVYIFWVGSNDWVLFQRIVTDIDPVADQIDSFLERNDGSDKYIVIGTTSRYELERENQAWRIINTALEERYGDHYLDIMDIINENGLGPDRTHLTQKSYDAIARAVYEKLEKLGYLDL